MMTTEVCVQRGIKFLDKNVEGWYNHVDLDILDMESIEYCVLGQVRKYLKDDWFGEFNAKLGFESWGVECCGSHCCSGRNEYRELKREWTKRIKEMQCSKV